MTASLEGGEWSASRSDRIVPAGKTLYPLYRRLGGPQGRSGRAKNLARLEFDPRTVQSTAQSLYRLSYPAHNFIGTRPTNLYIYIYIYIYIQVRINYRRISEPFPSNTGLRFSREMAVATIGPFQMYTFSVCNLHEFHDTWHFLLKLWRNEILR